MRNGIIIALATLSLSLATLADNTNTPAAPPKPYPLKTCLICGMQLGAMGKPYVFVYKGQEIGVCDKSEKAEFDKNPGKYMKKLADAEAKLKQ